jgi:hypothetical protein
MFEKGHVHACNVVCAAYVAKRTYDLNQNFACNMPVFGFA